MTKDRPGYSFDPGPPPDVMRYFRGKSLKPSFDFEDVEPEEHAVAFTVAKAMDLDVLTTIQGALETALAEGTTYADFQKTLKPRLKDLGWWGFRDMVDPDTGKTVRAKLGTPRRLKTIWRSNMRAARAAGQWDRIQRTKKALPYLMYLLGPSRVHRVEHAAKEGIILPVDHPFWTSWMPPNGFGCKCHVRQITEREAKRRGISEEPYVQMVKYRNPRTGRVKEVPRGIDPAWDRNPGEVRQRNADDYLAGKLDAATPAIARAAAIDMATSWRALRIHEGSATGHVPVAMVSGDAAGALGATTRVVRYSSDTAAKERAKHKGAVPDLLAYVQDAFDGDDVFQDGRSRVAFFEVGGKLWRYVIKPVADGSEIFMTSFHRTNDDARRKWRAAGGRPAQ